MNAFPLRLFPGQDLRAALETTLVEQNVSAAFVLQAIGSLRTAHIRFAGLPQATELAGDMEILTLAGTLSADGAHLHISVSDAQGRVIGGHVDYGCVVRTTAEVLVALLPAHAFSRVADAASGFKELVVAPAHHPIN
jgi:predicted DNA-binding protein with PD1-like motif